MVRTVMASDTPEPQPPDGPGAQAVPGPEARAPRVLVSVDDFEDPAEWDVIVVENEAIDDETAREIARQRAGRARPARSITLPSLDERDIMQALDPDRDAESPEGVSVDAFAPPEPTPVRRRPAREVALPPPDPFADLPEPGDPAPKEPTPSPGIAARPPGAAEVAETPDAARGPAEGAEAWSPAALSPVGPSTPAPPAVEGAGAPGSGTPTDDDVQDPSRDPGDAGTHGPPALVPVAWGTPPRTVADDPSDDFYAIGSGEDDEDGTPAAPTTEAAGGAGDAPGAAVLPGDELAPGGAFEDEVEFDSSFPLGPDDLKVDGELEPVDLDTLDYAAVFGPVRGTIHDPDHEPPRPRRRARLTYEDDLFLDDEDDDAPSTVPPPRTRGRRRELVVLGIAAGVMIALGIGSQIAGEDDPGLEADGTTTTSRERVRATSSTNPAITLPSIPGDTVPDATLDTSQGGEDGSTATTRPRTTTTRRSTPPTVGPTTPSTTAPPPSTTAPPPSTTAPPTTEPPTTAPPTTPTTQA